MTAVDPPTNAKQLAALVGEGEDPTVELKRFTGKLKEDMKTLCASHKLSHKSTNKSPLK